jgi:hypothetical protein
MQFPDKSLPHVAYLPFGPVRKTVTCGGEVRLRIRIRHGGGFPGVVIDRNPLGAAISAGPGRLAAAVSRTQKN